MANAAKYYGTGRRKKSIARVYLVPGKGDITINKRPIDEYFGLDTQDRLAPSDTASQERFLKLIQNSDLL